MNYSIYAESTPNPAVMKFVSNRILVTENMEILTVEDAKQMPLAAQAITMLIYFVEYSSEFKGFFIIAYKKWLLYPSSPFI